jgi:hypothetical protein
VRSKLVFALKGRLGVGGEGVVERVTSTIEGGAVLRRLMKPLLLARLRVDLVRARATGAAWLKGIEMPCEDRRTS